MPPRKREHPRTGPGSWQKNPDAPTEVNRTKVKGRGPRAQEQNRERFLEHPTDDNGRKICFAKLPRQNKHCQLDAGRGTDHPGYGKCSIHGGNTPALETNAAMYAGGEVIKKMSKGYGAPIDIDPHEALLQEVRRAAGHVQFLAERLNMFDLKPGSKPLEPAKIELIEWYQKERLFLVKVAKTAIDAGIAEARVQLERDKGALLVEVLRGVFEGLGLSVEQQRLLPTLVPAALRRLTEPQPVVTRMALPSG